MSCLPWSGAAQSSTAFGVSPAVHSVPDAQAGQRYVRTVILQNQLDTSSTIAVEQEGFTGGWTTTDPGSGFSIGPRSNRAVNLSIQVPAGASGAYTGSIRFLTEEKRQPDGSGAGVRYSLSVRLDVQIEGTPAARIVWREARIDATSADSPVLAHVVAQNEGNVRAAARARALLLPMSGDQELSAADAQLELDPGETKQLTFRFPDALPPGQYRLVIRSQPSGFETGLAFNVGAAGSIPPNAVLRALLHEPRATSGQPLRISAWTENAGPIPIAGARFVGEVRQDGALVAALATSPRGLPLGGHDNLSIDWTPPRPGTYEIEGHVEYDGYVTPSSTSVVTAQRGPTQDSVVVLWLIAAAFVFAAVLGGYAWRRAR